MSASLPLCTSPIVGGPVSSMVTTLLQALITAHCALTTPSAWPEDFGPTALTNLDSYDFVVIGSGAAGSVVASRLSENPSWNVLLLEAGDDPPSESEIPSMFLTIQRSEYTWGIEAEPSAGACLGTLTGRCYWPVAKTMGGQSSIDFQVSSRGSKNTFDEWNLPGWSWGEVTRYYDLAARYQSSASKPNGRLITNNLDIYNTCDILDVIFNGAEELGFRRLGHVEGSSRFGYGYVRGHVEKGQRMGAGKTYLSPAKLRPNLQVIKNAEVTKLNFDEGKTIQSVDFVYDGVELTVEVNKEVILAAGVLGSPKLLMLSGIGPKAELTALEIPVVSDLPGVGKNLQDQIGVFVPFQVKKSTAKSKTSEEKQIDTFYYLLNKYGPVGTIGTLPLWGFVNTGPHCSFKNCRYPDTVIHHLFSQRNDDALKVWYDSVGYSPAITEPLAEANADAHVLLNFVSLQNPKSRGHVELASNDYTDKIKVFADNLSEEEDVEALLQGIKLQMALEETPAYKKARAEILKLGICNDFVFKSDNYWRCFIRYAASTMYYGSGTTKMGISTDTSAVVDTELKVKGVEGLRVVGHSVMPSTIISTDPAVMFGERLAALLKADWGSVGP